MAQRNDGKKVKIVLLFLILGLALLGGYQLLQAGKHYLEEAQKNTTANIDRAIGKASE